MTKRHEDRPRMAMNLRAMPVDLHAHFKAYCKRFGYTMEMATQILIQQAVAGNDRLVGYPWRKLKQNRPNQETGPGND